MTLKLTGWKAIIAIVAAVAFVLIRYNMQSSALQTEGVEEVQRWLALEAARIALPGMQAAAAGSADVGEVEQLVSDLGQENFEIVSVTRHGMGERIVARVEYRHRTRSPADETDIRYLRMSYSLATGWRVGSETSRLNYHLAAF